MPVLKITPRKHDNKEKKDLVARIISELPEKFIEGLGEATAHLSQANECTIKIYPTPNTNSRIFGVFIPEGASVQKATIDGIFFEYKEKKILITYT